MSRVVRQRSRRASNAFHAMLVVCSAAVFQHARFIIPYYSRLHDELDVSVHISWEDSFAAKYARDNEFVPLAIVLAVISLSIACRKDLSPAFLNSVNVGMSMLWAYRYSVTRKERYFHTEAWIAVCRVLQGFVLGNASLTWLLHMCVTVVDITSYNDALEYLSSTITLQMGQTDTTFYAYRQVLVFSLISGLQWLTERASYREVEAACEAFRATEVEHGMERLLSSMCDAVVHLASDFSVVGSAQNLCRLLLLPTNVDSTNKNIHDYMSIEDGLRFRAHLSSASVAQDSILQLPPYPLHVNLFDQAQNTVPVELFCAMLLPNSVPNVPNMLQSSKRSERSEQYSVPNVPNSGTWYQV